jgi:hypothetical protein
MLASAFIVAISTVLLAYWFRYSCLLLLRDHTARASAAATAHAGPVELPSTVRGDGVPLAALEESLNRDYRLLTYLIEHGAGLRLNSLEDRMLVLDFQLMHWWYRLTRAAAPQQARQAVSEMALVLSILNFRIGRQPELQEPSLG